MLFSRVDDLFWFEIVLSRFALLGTCTSCSVMLSSAQFMCSLNFLLILFVDVALKRIVGVNFLVLKSKKEGDLNNGGLVNSLLAIIIYSLLERTEINLPFSTRIS